MYILGINAFHGDSSASLLYNGELIASVEEERFTRIKHWAGFPEKSIQYCLDEAGIDMLDVQYIAIPRKHKANLGKRAVFLLGHRQGMKKVLSRVKYWKEVQDIPNSISQIWNCDSNEVRNKIIKVEHHQAHMASTYFVSPFETSSIMSIDGFGDFVSAMKGVGNGSEMRVLDKIYYPHSLGLFYTLITQFLGFPKYGDEFKVMGLAAFGTPRYVDELRKIIKLDTNGGYKLHLPYFKHWKEGIDMQWLGGEPTMGTVYTDSFIKDFGNPRKPDEPITEQHQDLAASLQALTEEIIFHMLNDLYKKTGNKNLCLAGGVAMNSVANGKVFDNTPFEEIYIQSAAGDAGLSLGAAFFVWNQNLKNTRNFTMTTSYWGPAFSKNEIKDIINKYEDKISVENCITEFIPDNDELCAKTARYLADGNVIGWFQGRMEWGARALGNRSIIADPRRKDMIDVLNSRIKRRESFRPFAPSILNDATKDYFERDYPDPFMIKVYPILEDKRDIIPAVTHVDGTGRLQTVTSDENPLYYKLIQTFKGITGIPVILNTSFNENEPIVCKPEEALDCFFRTKMDLLVLGPYIISRNKISD